MSPKELIQRCRQLRSHVLARKLATEAEIEQHWPTSPVLAEGEQPPATWASEQEQDAWWLCFAQLARFVERGEFCSGPSDWADEQAMAALRDEPAEVLLSDGSRVKVYPKSFECLLWIRAVDWFADWLEDQIHLLEHAIETDALNREHIAEPSDVLARLHREIAYAWALRAAQACAPGPAFDSARAEDPGQHFLSLGPLDLERIYLAFLEVNVRRLQAARLLVPPSKSGKGGDDTPGWSRFFARFGDRWRIPPAKLTRDYSLVSLLMTAQLAQPDPIRELEEA